jgi:hypothetical protein
MGMKWFLVVANYTLYEFKTQTGNMKQQHTNTVRKEYTASIISAENKRKAKKTI